MNNELPQPVSSPAEYHRPSVAEQIRFMNPAFMDDVRQQQRTFLQERGLTLPNTYIPKDLTPEQLQARQELEQYSQRTIDQYVDQSVPPAIREDLVRSLNRYSVFSMDDVTWEKGEMDRENNVIKPDSSGKASLNREIERLERVLREPQELLVEARNQLAELSIQRRRKLSDRNKDLEKSYEQHAKVYADYQQLAGRDLVDRLRAEGKSDAEIKQQVIAYTLEEYRNFTQAEFDVLQSDTSVRGKVAKFLARSNRRFFATSFLAGGAIGFGARQALGTVGIATGVGLGAAAAVGLGVGTTRAALTSLVGIRKAQITEHGQRTEQDLQRFSQQFAEQPSDQSPNQASSQALSDAIAYSNKLRAERITVDQADNRRRLGKAALFGAAGGLLGAFGGILVSHLADNWPWTGSNPKPSPPTEAPPSPPTESTPPSTESPGAGADNNTKPPAEGAEPNNEIPSDISTTVVFEPGEGITYGLQDLGQAYDVALSAPESYEAYQYIAERVGDDFFTSQSTYELSNGDYGVRNPGSLEWDPAAMAAFQQWLIDNNKITA